MKELPQSPSAEKFDELPLDERDLVVETARRMHALVYQYAVPLTIGRTSHESPRLPVNSATASLLATGAEVVRRHGKPCYSEGVRQTQFW